MNSYPKRQAKPGRVDLVPKEFDDIIEDQGSRVRITPVALCPNRTSLHDTNHALDCPVCFGDEVVELTDHCVEDWAFIQGIKLNKDVAVQGIFDLKDATLTTKANIRLYYWYKVEVVDFASIFNQVLMRGSGNTDKIRYYPATSCDTPYYCVDSAGKQYTLNEDYKVDQRQRLIMWTGLNRPQSGKLYSFVYPILPTFRVIELLHDNRYYYRGFKQAEKTPVQLPQQALIRWDYIAKRSGSNVE